MDFKNKNVLILAPHTDDGELGCGGTINRAMREGANITYIAFSTVEEFVPEGFPPDQLEKELYQATLKLGIPKSNIIVFKYTVRKLNYVRQEILEELIKLRPSLQPDIVFMPALQDIHQDHSTIAAEGLRAFKQTSILGYELIWNNLKFETECFIKLEEEDVVAKQNALACYTSQQGRSYMDPDFTRSLARVRGTQVGTEYAEAFEVIRWVF